MAKSQSNDKLILDLKSKIEIKKLALDKSKRFQPITNCSLELFSSRFNLNASDKVQCMFLHAQLSALKVQHEKEFPEETLTISGYKVDEWLLDIKAKYENLNVKIEETRLKTLEQQLHNLLTPETKVGLELEELTKQVLG